MKKLDNKIYKGVFLLVIAYFASNLSYAQTKEVGKHKHPPIPSVKQIKEMVGKLSEEILLDKKQEDAILNFFLEHFKTVREELESGNKSREEMEELKSSFEKEVKSILSAEQQQKFDEFRKKNPPRHHNKKSEPAKN